MKPVRVGVLGCGAIATGVHLPNLKRSPGVEITVLAEPDPTRRASAAASVPHAAALEQWREVVAREDVDAVVVCLPTALHAEAAEAILAAGKHLYLEKPLAIDAPSGAHVVDRWRESGRVGMMGFNLRFNPLYQGIKEILDSGRIGRPAGFRSIFSAPSGDESWRRSRDGGGVLLDLASHHVDLVHFMFQTRVREVTAFAAARRFAGDTATVQLRLSDGLLAQSYFTYDACEEDSIEVVGDEGKAAARRYTSMAVEVSGPRIEGTGRRMRRAMRPLTRLSYGLRKRRATWHEPSYAAALERFLRVVRGEPLPYPDLEAGYQSLVVVDAAVESAATGRVIEIEGGRAPR